MQQEFWVSARNVAGRLGGLSRGLGFRVHYVFCAFGGGGGALLLQIFIAGLLLLLVLSFLLPSALLHTNVVNP